MKLDSEALKKLLRKHMRLPSCPKLPSLLARWFSSDPLNSSSGWQEVLPPAAVVEPRAPPLGAQEPLNLDAWFTHYLVTALKLTRLVDPRILKIMNNPRLFVKLLGKIIILSSGENFNSMWTFFRSNSTPRLLKDHFSTQFFQTWLFPILPTSFRRRPS